MNESQFGEIKVEGVGTFTPPPAPCGTEGCKYVLFDDTWEVIHVDECPEQ